MKTILQFCNWPLTTELSQLDSIEKDRHSSHKMACLRASEIMTF